MSSTVPILLQDLLGKPPGGGLERKLERGQFRATAKAGAAEATGTNKELGVEMSKAPISDLGA